MTDAVDEASSAPRAESPSPAPSWSTAVGPSAGRAVVTGSLVALAPDPAAVVDDSAIVRSSNSRTATLGFE
jgi:hypothetical protein